MAFGTMTVRRQVRFGCWMQAAVLFALAQPGMPIAQTLPLTGLGRPDLSCTLCGIERAPDLQGTRNAVSQAAPEPPPPSAQDLAAQGWRYFQEGRIGDALQSANALRDVDLKAGTLLRADLLLQLNALPLAVESYRAYAGDENVQRVLGTLHNSGLDQFERLDTGDGAWTMFPVYYQGKDLDRPVRYLFRKTNVQGAWASDDARTARYRKIDGPEIATAFALVSERPAPRGWSLKLAWRALWHWTWPRTADQTEYRLTFYSATASDVVAFWETLPGDEEILAAAAAGFAAADDLREAEKLSHSDKMDDVKAALLQLRSANGADYAHSVPTRQHYGALVNLARVARAVDAKEAGHFSRFLEEHYPYWGQLALAGLLVESGQPAQARDVLERAAGDWPLRHEALEPLADMQWEALRTAPADGRMEAGRELQRTLARLLARRPGLVSARLQLAQWHLQLGAFAPAAGLLREIARDTPDNEAATMLAGFKRLGRDAFEQVGEFSDPQGQRTLRAYRCLSDPPTPSTIIHHAAEVMVLDAQGHHLETFALSSQAFSDGGRREYFLDRITANGLQTLVRYRNSPIPSAQDLARELAAQSRSGT
jgi:hypothetical protein